jgi:menaquinone-dependent protoporphyrinogen oxidase
MRILVTYGSTRGGTQGLAEMMAGDLRAQGFEVILLPPWRVRRLDGYDAVIVGGALYASRWHRAARRFVKRHAAEIRQRPAFFFSSGPLDDSASRAGIPPVKGVKALIEKTGVREHITFGGRLRPDAKGFPASAMAKKLAGDWRDDEQVKQWTRTITSQLRGEVRKAGMP